ncbi:MAG: hypothetical protein AAGD01_18245 [Acidobacteriota bacterium]
MQHNANGLEALAQRGINLCRKGRLEQGLSYLLKVAERKDGQTKLPGTFYSYLGYGIALFQERQQEGLALCRHAVKMEFYEPENFLNLAQTQILGKDRRGALETLERGLKIDAQHAGLGALRRELGYRRHPLLPFLGRGHSLNVGLGKLIAGLRRRKPKVESEEEGEVGESLASR